MKRPDPEKSSRISQEFDDLKGANLNKDATERLKNIGDLLFDKDDIYTVKDNNGQLFRLICYKNKITEAYFSEMYLRYAINVLGKLKIGAMNNLENIKKKFRDGSPMTSKKFFEYVTLVLGLKVVGVEVTCMNTTTKLIETYKVGNNTSDIHTFRVGDDVTDI